MRVGYAGYGGYPYCCFMGKVMRDAVRVNIHSNILTDVSFFRPYLHNEDAAAAPNDTFA
jgi:hypothetical protein